MKILVIGSTGLIGRFVADALTPYGEVIGISRTTPIKIDVKDPVSIKEMYKSIGKFDHLASCIGKVTFKSILDISYDEYLASVKDKAIGQVELVRAGIEYINDGGSFTLMTGILARNPIPAGSAASLANGAVESFTKAAAIELPRGIRINTVSPSVLVEATSYHSAFPGFHQVTGKEVADAYIKAITGKMTGEVFKLD